MPTSGAFTSLNQIEEYILQCELRRLNLDDEGVWSRAYLSTARITNNPRGYEGHVEFQHIRVQLISSKEALLGCSPLHDGFIYMTDNTDDNLCFWQCLIISQRIRCNWAMPAQRTMRDILKLACKFYEQPSLRVSDVRWTKLIDLENIASKFWVYIKLYESINQLVWKLGFGHMHHRSSFPNIDFGIYQGHCFCIKNLDGLANHRECMGCQQRFTHRNNDNRHVTEKWCTGGQAKLVCDGGKFKHIMNCSEKVFYGGNTQVSWKACRWIERQSEIIGRHIHHTLYGHGGERCVVIDKKKSWLMDMILRLQLSISSMDASGTVVLAWDLTMASTRKF